MEKIRMSKRVKYEFNDEKGGGSIDDPPGRKDPTAWPRPALTHEHEQQTPSRNANSKDTIKNPIPWTAAIPRA